MNKALATKEQATESAILDIRALSKAGSTLTALLQHLQQDRVLLEGSTQRSGVSFARIGNVVLRVTSVIEKVRSFSTGRKTLFVACPTGQRSTWRWLRKLNY
jgi:hypothetical protein